MRKFIYSIVPGLRCSEGGVNVMIMEAVKWLRSEECGNAFGTIFINALVAWSVISKPCHAHPPSIGCLFQATHEQRLLLFYWLSRFPNRSSHCGIQ